MHCSIVNFSQQQLENAILVKNLMGLMFFVQIFHSFCYKNGTYLQIYKNNKLPKTMRSTILSFLCYKIIRLVSVSRVERLTRLHSKGRLLALPIMNMKNTVAYYRRELMT